MGIGRHFVMKNMLSSNYGECLIAQLQTFI